MQQQNMGPSGQLIALGRFSPGFEVVVCDLTGPVYWQSADGQTQSLYFLVCVSAHWGETKILPIQSKHTEDLVLGLKTLALQKACQFTLLYSDQGAEFSQCQNSFSPMKPLIQPEPLGNLPTRVLVSNYVFAIKQSLANHNLLINPFDD